MPVTLGARGDAAATLNEIAPSGAVSNVFNLPVSKPTIVALLRTLLADPNERQVEAGPVIAERMRDGVRVHISRANFLIPYADLFPLVLEG